MGIVAERHRVRRVDLQGLVIQSTGRGGAAAMLLQQNCVVDERAQVFGGCLSHAHAIKCLALVMVAQAQQNIAQRAKSRLVTLLAMDDHIVRLQKIGRDRLEALPQGRPTSIKINHLAQTGHGGTGAKATRERNPDVHH